MKNETILIQVRVNKADYNKLTKYGFMFDKNIDEYLHDIAQQLRDGEKMIKHINKIHLKGNNDDYIN